ncbi:hypothetical protein [Catelliglobosispora koreensis]|uniref:hypothetical protein n=1 Tax=Catelliglobosispora koreensis TaxID=129052 RepID=UPI000373DD40|nr:hypothetical protein [Catelliglobosispora koreensis]
MLLLVSPVLIVMPARAEGPTLAWVESLHNSGGEFAVHPDGSVTITSGCGSEGATVIETVSASQQERWTVPTGAQGLDCWRPTTAAGDQIAYTHVRDASSGQLLIAAHRHGTRLWLTDLPEPLVCAEPFQETAARDIKVGADGNVYVLTTAAAADCHRREFRVIGLRAADGSIMFSTSFAPTEDNVEFFDANAAGLVAASPSTAYWIAYTGEVTATASLPETDLVEGFMGSNNADGRFFAFLNFRQLPQGCPAGSTSAQSVVAIDNGHIRWRTKIVGHCTEPVDIDALPDGGVVVTVIERGRAKLIRFDAGGHMTWLKVYGPDVIAAITTIDGTGLIVVQADIDTGDTRRARTIVYSADNHTVIADFTTEQFDGLHNGFANATRVVPGTDLAPGRIYLPVVRCFDFFDCNYIYTLYAVTVPGITGDYPRVQLIS